MELKEFQLNAVKSLFEAMDKPVRDIILQSPTGFSIPSTVPPT